VTANPGASSIVVSGGALGAAPSSANPAQCNIRVNVTATNAGNTSPPDQHDPDRHLERDAGQLSPTGGQREPRRAAAEPRHRHQVVLAVDRRAGEASIASVRLTNAGSVALTNFGFVDNVGTMGGAPGRSRSRRRRRRPTTAA
jgi:hypothetical protein